MEKESLAREARKAEPSPQLMLSLVVTTRLLGIRGSSQYALWIKLKNKVEKGRMKECKNFFGIG
jgi:hypothetical protein